MIRFAHPSNCWPNNVYNVIRHLNLFVQKL